MRFILLLACVFGASDLVISAEILAVIPSPFYSHQNTFRPLWRQLSRRGHKITLITTDPMEKNENITQINYHEMYNVFKKNNVMDLFKKGYGFLELMSKILELLDEVNRFQFTHPDLLELLQSGKKFDVMMVEFTLPIWPLLSVKFDCPLIGLSTMDTHPGAHAMVGNAVHSSLYPYADFGYGEKLSFKERIFSAGFTVLGMAMGQFVFSPLGNRQARRYLGDGLPDCSEIYGNTSLLIVNANPIFFSPRPVVPITVNLEGGLHLAEPKKLPQDLQKYLDDSKNGCIYVSFGTTVNSEYLSKEQKDVLVNVFKKMAPMRILWKFDDLNVAKGVPNVEVRNWVPQQDILRHPNVKLFITQGGLQSMEEAIDSAVPMLGMPFYGDQVNNVNKMHQKKFGLGLQPKTMNEVSLKSALEELLNNPIYKKNIDKFSAISKDRPMKGLEKAVWWTEYVLRHGTEHLRSPSADIPLYQYFFLDVIAFFSVSLYGLYLFTKYSFRLTCLSIRYLYGALRGKKEKKD